MQAGRVEIRQPHVAHEEDLQRVFRISHSTHRLANTTNITFHGVESEALLILRDKEGICAS
ncbi:MAG: hypothetical protein AAB466_00760 [Verrucomicrobiota bacterium]